MLMHHSSLFSFKAVVTIKSRNWFAYTEPKKLVYMLAFYFGPCFTGTSSCLFVTCTFVLYPCRHLILSLLLLCLCGTTLDFDLVITILERGRKSLWVSCPLSILDYLLLGSMCVLILEGFIFDYLASFDWLLGVILGRSSIAAYFSIFS